jgi:polyisoprenoid-binding protein YceI
VPTEHPFRLSRAMHFPGPQRLPEPTAQDGTWNAPKPVKGNDKPRRLTMEWERLRLSDMRLGILCLLASAAFPSGSRAQTAPIFEITPVESWIKFDVKASMDIAGKFDKWDATLVFTSPDETTGVLEIKIQANSVDTGSGMKNGKLKGKDFFDVEHNPVITFKSTKIVRTGHDTYEVDGDFAIRGVSNPEKLTLIISGKGTGSGEVKGKMVFNRKDYGMNKGIPFIKIADHVEVNFHLKGKRVSGPPLLDK